MKKSWDESIRGTTQITGCHYTRSLIFLNAKDTPDLFRRKLQDGFRPLRHKCFQPMALFSGMSKTGRWIFSKSFPYIHFYDYIYYNI